MVTQSQSEIKKLLSQQLSLETSKVVISFITGISATILIPLSYNSTSNDSHKIINLLSFCGGVSCFTFAYSTSNNIKEYKGKIAMFKELEKQRFIKEQILSQEVYLSQLESQFLPVLTNSLDCQSEVISHSVSQSETNHSQLIDNQSMTVSQSVNQNQAGFICPQCNSININKNGKRDNLQKLICKDCDHNFQVQISEV